MKYAHTIKTTSARGTMGLHAIKMASVKLLCRYAVCFFLFFPVNNVTGRRAAPTEKLYFACPVLAITNPPATCAPASVDLTDPAVTAGSSLAGATLSYWTDAAATVALANPSAVTASGTYYIKAATPDPCSDIKPVTVVVNSVPVIFLEPADNLICANNVAAFYNTDATGVYTIQWQISTNGGGLWTNIAGATGKTYSFSPQPSESGEMFRAIYSNGCGADTTRAALLSVGNGVNFPKDLLGQFSCDGSMPLSTKITGGVGLAGDLTYFWERSTDNVAWSLIPGTTETHTASGTYTPSYTPGPGETSYFFRLGVNNNGCVTYTNSAKVTINPASDVNQPANVEVCHNNPVTVNFTGTNASTFTWTNNNTAIGLAASGSGNISFTATNPGAAPIIATIVVTPHNTANSLDCLGSTKTFTIIVNPLPVITTTSTNVSCFGGNNGTATANPATGAAPFTYSWNTLPVQNTQTATGLAAGTYIVTVTDAKGCSRTASVTISQPPAITASPMATPVNILCNGAATGAVNLTVNAGGGTGTLTSTYAWSNGATTQNITGLPAGTYTVTITVTDANNCVKNFTASATVTQAALIVPTASAPAILCNGGTTVVTVAATGGTPYGGGKYDFSINGSTFNTSGSPFSFSNVAAGSYTVTVRDAKGCIATTPVVIAAPPPPIIASASAPAVCSGLTSAITVTASGGTGLLQYSLNGSSFQVSDVFNNVAGGNYTITIKDANGCTITTPAAVLTYPLPPAPTAVPVSRCGPGTVTIDASNCAGTISWYDVSSGGSSIGSGTPFTTASITANTTFYFSCTDANGCISPRASVAAKVVPVPIVVASSNSPVCEGNNIVLSATNFPGTATYDWTGPNGFATTTTSTSVTIPNATLSMAGTYTVVVTVNGCPSLPSPVDVTVNPKTPPVAIPGERCGAGPVTLGASGCSGTLNWYSNSTGGSSLGTGTTFVTSPVAAGSTVTYYVSCTVGACVSPRTPVVATAKIIPACSITGPNNLCPGMTSTYTAPAGMDTYEWTISGNGTIQGSTSGQSVDVSGGATCGNYTLSLITSLNGCTNTCSQPFSISDITRPVITPTGTTLTPGCNPDAATINAALGTATATDNCSVGAPVFTDGAVTNTGCTYSQTRTWNVTDICGNAAIPVSRTVTWTVDLADPVIIVTAATALSCNPTSAQIAAAFGTASVTDNCSTGLTATFTDGAETAGAGCSYSVTRTWTVTDACGNTGTNTQTVTFTRDIVDPVINVTAATALPCNPTSAQIAAAFGTASVTDNCSTGLTATFTDGAETAGAGCSFSVTRTWMVTDACGNTGTKTQTVTFTRDVVDPVITVTAATALSCNPTSAQIAAAFGTASVTDNCSTGLIATFTDGAETAGAGCSFSVTRTWMVTDACGNTGTKTQTVTFTRDVVDPVITVTAATALPCNPTSAQIAAAFGTASVTDNCSTGLTATFTDGAETAGAGCSYSVTRTWTATDACGNTGTKTQTVSFVRDTQKPTVTGTLTITGTSCNVKPSFVDPTATDNCGSTTLKAGYPIDGTVTLAGCTSSQTRTWIYVDPCGNESDPFVQTISWTTDTQKPTVTGTATITGTTCNVKPAFVDPTANDNCGSTTLKAGYPIDGTVTLTGCTSSQTRTWIYIDPCGNESDPFVQTILWAADTQKPTVTGTATITGTSCNVKPSFVDPTASDNCGSTTLKAGYPIDGTVTLTGCTSSQTRTWIYVDPCGNESDPFVQTISWTTDTQKPTVTGTTTVTGTSCNVKPSFVDPTASDNCGSTTLKTGYPIDGTVTITGCTSSQTRTWIYVDPCGNESDPFVQTISWTTDTQKPTITGTTTVTGTSCNVKPSFVDPTASDNCGSTTLKTGYPQDGTVTLTGCTSSQTRTWIYVDPCGNESDPFVQTISWTTDTQKPTVTGTATITGTSCNVKPAFVDPAASDNCGSTTLKAGYPIDGTVTLTGCTSSQTRTWVYVDPCGNESDPFVQTVSWTTDTQKPTVTGTTTITGTSCNVKPAFVDPTANDNCGSTTLKAGYPQDGTVTLTGCTSSQTRTWVYVDPCGNESDPFVQTINWTTDTQKPTVTGTTTITGTSCNVKPSFVDPTASDNCGSTTLKAGFPQDGTVTITGCTSSQTRTWIYVDPCGNESDPFVQTISWTTDTQKPTVTGTATITGTTCNVKPTFIDPTATDNCGSTTLKAGYPIDGTVTLTGCTSNQTRTWIYVDPCGNESEPFVQTISWTTDTQKPTVTGTATITGNTCNVKPSFIDPTASDNCGSAALKAGYPIDGTVTLTGCTSSQTRTWVYVDPCGNESDPFVQTISWTTDTQKPTVTGTPTITGTTCNVKPSFVDPTASDNCGSTILKAGYPQDGTVVANGCTSTQTRTWIYVDPCGNESDPFVQTISWTTDTQKPTVTGITTITGTSCNVKPAFVDPTASDNCGSITLKAGYPIDGTVTLTGCTSSQTKTWIYIDPCGNESDPFVQTINWTTDTQKPTVTGTATITGNTCNVKPAFVDPAANDNCGSATLKAGYPQDGTVTLVGCTSSQTRTWIYVDPCGNESDPFVQIISWTTDTQKPTVTGTATITGTSCNVKPAFVDPTANDNCGSTTLKAGYPIDGTVTLTGCTSSQTRTWIYVDPCGNESDPFVQTISWTTDTQKPTVTGTATITGNTCNVKPTFIDPTATDNCGSTTLKAGYPIDGTVTLTGCTSSQTRTWIYVDPCGNESDPFVQTISWTTDTQKPTVTGTATIAGTNCNVKPSFVDPTASDNCGSATLKAGYPVDGTVTLTGCTSSQTRTWIYVDPCGKESEPFVQTISWTTDTQKPTVTGTATITGTTCNVKPAFVDPSASDNCGSTTLKAGYPQDGTVTLSGCTSSQTRTWIYVDPCGNESDPFVQTISWTTDNQKPTVTGTATITGTNCNVKPAFVDPTASDNCGSTTLKAGYPIDGTVTLAGCTSSQTRTWIYVDPCGNESDPFVQTISWTTDTQKPTVTGTATISGTTCNVKPSFVDPTASDNCGSTTLKTGYPIDGTVTLTGCTSSQTRTWIYIDPCGNESDPFVQTISWTTDTQKPTVTGTTTVTGTSCNVKPSFVDPTVTDNCGSTTLKAGYPQDGAVTLAGCTSSQTRTWIYVDPCGNESDPFVQTISWTTDTQKPTVTGTATITGTTCNVKPTFIDPTATDNCGSTTLKTGYPVDGTVTLAGCTSSQTRTWIYVDPCGNESDPFVQTISWTTDTQKPTVTGTATITGNTCNVKPSFIDPTASDNCGSTTLKAGYPIDGTVTLAGCTSSQTRTWIYVDPCGNESDPFVQTISWTTDTQKPTVTGTATITGNTCNVKPAFVDPTASDNCGSTTLKAGYPQDGTVTLTGCTSSQTRTWIYVDPCGNESDPFVQTISWTTDTQKPTVTGTATITGTTCNVKPSFVDPTASDNCGSTTLKAGYPQDGTVVANGCTSTQTRTWVYVDPCGNESDPFVQTISWTTDTQKPTVTGTVTITGNTCNVKPAFINPTASDNCGSTTLKAGYPIDETVILAGCTSSQTRTWIYVDPCGNESDPFVQTISWTTDTQKPTVTGTKTITGTSCNVKPAFVDPSASDNCGSTTLKAGYPVDGTVTLAGCTSSQTRTWIYVDPCGNESDPFVQTISWTTDTQKPTVTGTATITGTSCNVKPAFVDPTASDNCGSTTLKTGYPIDGTVTLTGCTSSQTRTWVYVDPCGNESDPFVQTISWTTDTQKPTVIGTATITGNTCNVKPSFIDPTANDNCGSTTLKAGYPIDGTVTLAGCTSSQTRTWIYVDPCGNESDPFVQTISWTTDTQKPTVTGTATITGTSCNVKPAFVDPTASDNCGSTTLKAGYPQDGTVVANGCTSTQTRTWVYVDPCGNESDPFVQTISWTADTQKPTLTCPGPQQFCIAPGGNYIIPALIATDNCTGTLSISWIITGATNRNGTGTNADGSFNVGVSTITWTATDACGNTETCTTSVNIRDITTSNTNITICANQLPYNWNGQSYNAPGSYIKNLTSVSGCDSTATLHLFVNPVQASTTNKTICTNQLPYTWNGQSYNAAGTYTKTLTSVAGCDSIATLNLAVNATLTSTTNTSICTNQLPYTWNGQSYNAAGTYTKTLTSVAGCDSIATLNLAVNATLSSTTNTPVCTSQLPYTWNGQSYNAAGTYTKNLTSVSGCDSIATLNLSVNATVTSTTNTNICSNQLPYTWNGQAYSAAGTYTKTLTSAAGCDSIATLKLTIDPVVTSITNISLCTNQMPYTWNGQVYNAAGTYTRRLTAASGCDSIATLNLAVNPALTSITNLSICTNQTPYTWNGQTYTATGTYTKKLTSASGCDSMATLNLVVSAAVTSTTNLSICTNQTPYTWNGQAYSSTGTYTKTLTSASGCDSIATLNLVVSAAVTGTTNITICLNQTPYTWNGQTYTATGTYTKTLTSASGCDSIATLNLVVNPAVTSTTNLAICATQTPYLWNGQSYTSTGTYTKTLTTASGCDSIATLKLVVNPAVTSTTNIAICTNQTPYTWNGQAYILPGTYSKTLTSASGCDSIATLNLVVNPTVTSTTNLTICTNQTPYTWNGQAYSATGIYPKTLKNASGCDSIATLNLVVNPAVTSTTNLAICTNQTPYTWNGQNYSSTGTYSKTLSGASGCDSIAVLNLVVNAVLAGTTNATICASQLPYSWNGQSYSAAGTYTKTLSSASGCDSIATLNLAVNATLTSTSNIAICSNQLPYSWNGQSYTAAGTYTKTLKSVFGCDSIATLNLSVNATLTGTTNAVICNNQLPYTWNGQSYTAAGTYSKTLTSAGGCDSIATLNLVVNPAVTSSTDLAICSNQTPYNWNGQAYASTGTYTKTLKSASGCDSIATLNLVVNPVVTSTTGLSICSNQIPYTWNGQAYNTAGTYSATLKSAAGCDSIATLNLTIRSTLSGTTNIAICINQLPYTWNGQTYNAAGTYTKTLTGASGCDSIATLNLAVNPALTGNADITICPNQLPYSWNGQVYTAAGTYTKALKSISGCDSIVTLNLAVNATLTSSTNITVCADQLPYSWNGQSYNTAGTYTKTLTSSTGCDSIATLVLAVNATLAGTTDIAVCSNQLPYSWNGQTYNAAGTYTKTLKSTGGCDSIATLNLAVTSTLTSTTNETICTNQLPYNWNGQSYNAAGTYTKTLTSASGCDSVATLHLAVDPVLNSTVNKTICTNELPYNWNGQAYNAAGTYSKTLTSAAGCDSIVTLNLTVNPVLTGTTNETVCAKQLPFTWNGQAYNAAGTYTKTLKSVSGCDSIATLVLAVNPALSSTTNITICASQLPYTWNGQAFNTAGSFTTTLTSVSGCDSIATLNLAVNATLASTTNISVCSGQLPYSWNGQSYNATGTYSTTLKSLSGCDSIVTLNLSVNPALTGTTNITICTNQLPYTWNGQAYNAAGIYTKTLTGAAGCDSIATLNLTVNATLTSTTNQSICAGELPFNWNGQDYNAAGTYTKTLSSASGCDSIATLNLSVNPALTGTTNITICTNQLPYTWNGQAYNAAGVYSKTLKSITGCDSIATLNLEVNPALASTTNLSICTNQTPYSWNGQAYSASGTYVKTLKSASGCDSIATLNLTVNSTLTSTTNITICTNQLPYSWNGQTYNAAGTYTKTFTSASGCNSIATLNLVVNATLASTTNISVCASQLPYSWNGQTYNAAGTYSRTLTGASGCDSVATLNLSVNPVLTGITNISVCTNQLPYTWNGQSYNAAGTYTKTLNSASGCDSIATLNLTVNSTLTSTTNETICTNQLPYNWNGQTYNAAGTYTKTLKSASGCDSIATLNLVVNSTLTSITNETICTNQLPYSWNGQTYNAAGTYTKTLKSASGCDSIATLNLAVNATLASTTNETICTNQLPYTWNGQSYNATGTYTKTLKSASGCDSIATLNLTVNSILTSTTNDTICTNQLPYTWNGQSYNAAGTYTKTLKSASGCDSIATLNLTVNSTLTSTTNEAICTNQLPYSWNGQTYNAGGTYTKTLKSASGCDSIATLNLVVNSTLTSTTNEIICTNQLPYSWNGQTYNAAGTYTKTLKSASGCDSISTLNLTVNSTLTSTTNETICTNQLPYSWNGQTYNAAGTYTKTLKSASGCDSISTLNLTVNATLTSTTNETICTNQLPYIWNGQSYNTAGTYTKTLKSTSGCDSIATLNLTVNSTLTSTTNETICTNQLPYSWNGQTYNAAGTYTKTLKSVSGCDSIATLNLTVNATLTSTTNETICTNQLPYSWNGQSYNAAGTYTKTLKSASGCDSIATLNLTVNSTLTSTTNETICTNQLPYSWNGQTYNAAGTYTKTFTSASGCDSIATLNLTVNSTLTSIINETICTNQLPYSWNGQTFNAAGTYTKTFTSASGCDSIATLNLTVNNTLTSTTNETICTNQLPYTWNGQTYNVAGTYTKTLKSASGCDSIATLNLTVNASLTSTTNETICTNQLPYNWNGQTYNATGTYTKTLKSASGCDSIATLNLTVNSTLTSTTNETICTNQLPYTWNRQTYNAAGTYTKTLKSVSGCDSVATLNLTVNATLTSTTNETICTNQLPYSWNGQSYNATGTYTKTFTSASGCDSIATLNLTANSILTSITNETICTNQLPYIWNGQTYNASGTYTKTFTSASGCDSIATLNLTVNSILTSITNETICTNQLPYIWNGQTYNASGTYTKTFTSASGCDSIATLNLTVNSTLTSITNSTICTNQLPYTWNGQTYNDAGTYTKTLKSASGCDSIATLNLTVNNTLTSTTNETICTNQLPYSWNGQSYNAAGTYTKTFTSASGCDSIATLNLAVNATLTSTTNETICTNQLPYSWNGQTYNAAGTYTKTLKSVSGCDSITTLNLAVNSTLTSTTNETICTNQLPYSWNGQTYNAAGTYTKTFTSASGCDSIATLNLAVNATLASTTNISVCTNQLPYSWNDQTYNAAGTYTKTLKSASGCDSIATLNLAVNATLTSTTNETICTNQLPYSWNGQTYNAAGTYTKTLKSASGCDSIATLNLTVNSILTSITNETICSNQLPYRWNGQAFNVAGTYTKKLTSISGCDSIATLNLVVNDVPTGNTNVSICSNEVPYNWHGQAYDKPGRYTKTLKSAGGCDSTDVLNLTVNAVKTSHINAAICTSQLPYTWNGQQYHAGGVYKKNLKTATGCDSTVTLDLTVASVLTSTATAVICENQLPYTWNGQAYHGAGTYRKTLKARGGCDSIAVLNLVVNSVLTGTTNISICINQLPYVWNGQRYNAAGTFTKKLTSAAGCDSIATLKLQVSPVINASQNVSTCDSSYLLPGGTLATKSGTYKTTLKNAAGCDSIITTVLVLKQQPDLKIHDPAATCAPGRADITTAAITAGSSASLTLSYWTNAGATIGLNDPAAIPNAGTYYIRATNRDGCFIVKPVSVRFNEPPSLTVTDPPATCTPGVADLTNAAVTAGSQAGLVYTYWTNAAATIPLANPQSVANPGKYYIRAVAANACAVIKPVDVVFTTTPVLVITHPAAVCAPATVDLTSSSVTSGSDPGLRFTYWQDAACTIPITDPANVSASGRYYVRAFKTGNCFTIKPVEVVVTVLKNYEGIRYPTLTGSVNTPLQLEARIIGINDKYLWQPPDGLNQANTRTPVFRYNREMEYMIHIKQLNGCETTDTLLVKLRSNEKCPEIFVPKAWSPNQDGHNDKLFPLITGPVELKFFRVFNRWGQLVFETNQPGQGWDGNFKNIPQVKDVYTWTLEASSMAGNCHYKMAGNSLLLR